jgi:hypothetical protein
MLQPKPSTSTAYTVSNQPVILLPNQKRAYINQAAAPDSEHLPDLHAHSGETQTSHADQYTTARKSAKDPSCL